MRDVWDILIGFAVGWFVIYVVIQLLIEPGIERFKTWWEKPTGRYR